MKRQVTLLLLTFLVAAALVSAAPIMFTATLSGAAEFPSNTSPGTGFTVVTIDPDAHTMQVFVDFSGLDGMTTAAHIHIVPTNAVNPVGPVATAVPTFPGFPLGVSAGVYNQIFDTLDAATYNPTFLNNAVNMGDVNLAEGTLFAGILSGRAYLNVHSTIYPGGEIRGFLVPEPGTIGLSAAALLGLVAFRLKIGRA